MDSEEELENFIVFSNQKAREQYWKEVRQQGFDDSESGSDMEERRYKRRKRATGGPKKMPKKQAILLHALKHFPDLEMAFIKNDKDMLMSQCSEEELLHHWVHLHREWYSKVFAPHMSFENAAYFMEQHSMTRQAKQYLNKARELKVGPRETRKRKRIHGKIDEDEEEEDGDYKPSNDTTNINHKTTEEEEIDEKQRQDSPDDNEELTGLSNADGTSDTSSQQARKRKRLKKNSKKSKSITADKHSDNNEGEEEELS